MCAELIKAARRNERRRDATAGYTLTEMLIVIVIIGLLAAAITPGIIGQLGRARARTAQMHIDTVAAAVETYRSDVGMYPAASQGLGVLVAAPAETANWLGPYLRSAQATRDPWGRELVYQSDGDGTFYSVMSLGADGREGGAGVNQDISVSTGP